MWYLLLLAGDGERWGNLQILLKSWCPAWCPTHDWMDAALCSTRIVWVGLGMDGIHAFIDDRYVFGKGGLSQWQLKHPLTEKNDVSEIYYNQKYTILETLAILEGCGRNLNIWHTPIILSHYFGISEICGVAKLKFKQGCENQILPILAGFCTGAQLW